jgi:uncharacterized membrane protein (DUF4010 family)
MDMGETFRHLGIAVALGLLVGIQRQRTDAGVAGFRTFPLATAFGTLCALLAGPFGHWIVAAGLLTTAAMVVLGNLARMRAGTNDPGLTTEFALVVMYAVGAFLVIGPVPVALAVGAGVAVLLHLKPQMHSLAARIGEGDFKAIMQFVLISLVILPVLPDRAFGPFGVLNPHRIWLMVVLIVAVSLGGYVAYKLFGARVGSVLGGLLGGLISSTATTVSYARRSRDRSASPDIAAFVIAVASAVVFLRVLAWIAVAAPHSLPALAGPVLMMLGAIGLGAAGLWLAMRGGVTGMPPQSNPTELKSAVTFGLLFALVLFAVAAAREHLGEGGLFAVAALSGLTDMDAITLSTAQLVHDGALPPGTGWRLILVASMANLLFKLAAAALLGGRALALRLALVFGLGLLAGAGALLWWPK